MGAYSPGSGAGKRGHGDHQIGLGSFGHGYSIDESQSAFGIGMSNLYFLTAGSVHNGIWQHRGFANEVGRCREKGMHFQFCEIQLLNGINHSQHGSTAGHIGLHGIHVVSKLNLYAACIEYYAFSHQSDSLLCRGIGQLQMNPSRRIEVHRSPGYREKAGHIFLNPGSILHHRDFHSSLLCNAARFFSKSSCPFGIGRHVYQVLRSGRRLIHGFRECHRIRFSRARFQTCDVQTLDLRQILAVLSGSIKMIADGGADGNHGAVFFVRPIGCIHDNPIGASTKMRQACLDGSHVSSRIDGGTFTQPGQNDSCEG